jgi:hypothetical protein
MTSALEIMTTCNLTHLTLPLLIAGKGEESWCLLCYTFSALARTIMRTFRNIAIEWWPVLVLMLIAGALRFYELGAWPPGLYHDEAYNGLDALRVVAGDHPLYFAANHGREPFFIYLAALSVGWLGRSVYAVRFPAAIIGTLLIPAAYFMARELFGRRVGLLTAAITTITLWPLQLSLIGFRRIAAAVYRAVDRHERARLSIRTHASDRRGYLYGLSFYTYRQPFHAARLAIDVDHGDRTADNPCGAMRSSSRSRR